jgi:hypothetical protein
VVSERALGARGRRGVLWRLGPGALGVDARQLGLQALDELVVGGALAVALAGLWQPM